MSIADDPLARFSVTLGGPLNRLYQQSRLLRPPVALLTRRLIASVAVAWLPLLVLTAAEGTAVHGVRLPFIADLATHVRLIVVLPLLIAAEPWVHRRMTVIARQFVECGIVGPEDRRRFESIIETTVRMRNSIAAEVVLFGLTTAAAIWIRHEPWSSPRGVWYLSTDTAGHYTPTMSGWWYSLVSINLLRFLLLRWYYRLLIWYQFLWRTSRLPLRLNPLHPDRAGGLGFLSVSLAALAPVFIAQSLMIAGVIAGRILNDGMALTSFASEIAAVPIVLAVVATLPLAFFSMALLRTRLEGPLEYGQLATRYVDEFRRTWLAVPGASQERLLGTADIQSLADLANAYGVVQRGLVVPVGPAAVLRLTLVLALPFLPLALTMLPFAELVHRVIGALL